MQPQTGLRKLLLNAALLCWLFTGIHPARGQPPLWFHLINEEDNLSASRIINLYLDSEGICWIGTMEGLFSFDGFAVRQYPSSLSDSTTLQDNYITGRFFEDSRHNLWFSTNTAIHCYHRQSGTFTRHFVKDQRGLYIKEGYLSICLERDTFLWISTSNREIYRMNIRDFTQSNKLGQATLDIEIYPGFLPDGNLKYLFCIDGTKSPGLELFEIDKQGSSLHQSKIFDGNQPGLPALNVTSLHFGQEDIAWLATTTGIYKWNITNNSLARYSTVHSEPLFLEPFVKNHFLVSQSGEGLYLFNKTQGHFNKWKCRLLDNPDFNLDTQLKTPYPDPYGNLWLIIPNLGLLYANLSKTKVNSIPKMPLYNGTLNYTYRTILQGKDGNIWCSTLDQGLFLLNENGEILRHYHPEHPAFHSLTDRQVNHIMLDRSQNLWVCGGRGVSMLPSGTGNFIPVFDTGGRPIPYVVYFNQLHSGEILASSLQQGIYQAHYGKRGWELEQLLSPNSNSDFYTTIYQDSLGSIYLCHNYVEISVFRFSNGKLHPLVNIPLQGFVNGFHEDKDGMSLWVATSSGLFKLNKTNLAESPVHFSEQEGLVIPHLKSITTDKAGNLWMGSTKGLIRFDKSKFTPLTLADGIQSPFFDDLSVLAHADGSLWFGGSNGITIVVPENIQPVRDSPKILLTSIKVHEQTLAGLKDCLSGATNVSQIRNLRFPFRQNTISFDFVGIDYSDPTAVQLEYYLERVDNDWVRIERGKPGYARYPNLSPGNYTFNIRAANSDGLWSDQVFRIKITIDPPWYQRWWARVLFLATASAIAYALFRYRIAQIRKEAGYKQKEAEFRQKEAEFKQLAAETETAVLRLQMNPHFIFNSINSINSYILQKNIDTASEYLGRFATLMRSILKQAAKPTLSIWEEKELLEQYLQTEMMRFEGKFDYSIEIEDNLDPDDTLVPTMILQPFVENAILHGIANKQGKGHICVRFASENGSLLCSVQDNGIGRNAALQLKNPLKKHESKALDITARRLTLLWDETGIPTSFEVIDLQDTEGKAAGTKVVLKLPLF